MADRDGVGPVGTPGAVVAPSRRAGWPVLARLVLEGLGVGLAAAVVVVVGLAVGDVAGGRLPAPGPGELLRGLGPLAAVVLRVGAGIGAVVVTTAAAVLVPVLVLHPEARRAPAVLGAAAGLATVLTVGLLLPAGAAHPLLAVLACGTAGALTAWRGRAGVARWDPAQVRPLRVPTGSGPLRAAAGTRLGRHLLARPWELARAVAGRPFSDPGADLTAYRDGEPVALGAFRLEDGAVRHGLLVLQRSPDGPTAAWSAWRRGRGYGAVDLPGAPARVPRQPRPVRWRRAGPRRSPAQLTVGDDTWLLLVRRHDLPLLRDVVPVEGGAG